jgi:hypothetical protein
VPALPVGVLKLVSAIGTWGCNQQITRQGFFVTVCNKRSSPLESAEFGGTAGTSAAWDGYFLKN